MEGHNSTLTGSQIEERLQLVPKHSQDIALLQEAIKAFVSSEQMQTAITNALTDYYTKDESNKLLATKQTAEQVSAAITAALTSYSNTEQMQTAITAALASYYTKDESNNLLAAKQTAEQVSAAITAALTSYSSTEQMQAAITNALTDYYTKDESNNLLAAKQTAEQVSAAITAALTSYSSTEQMQAAITNALTDYYTKDESNNLLATKQTAEQVSAAITAALTSYSNTEQMQTAITAALASYYTKDESNNLLATKQTAEQVSAAITEALTSYSSTEQMQTAITNALTDYYTKDESNNLLAAKQTAEQVSAAITAALTSYSSTEQMQTAITAALASYYTKDESNNLLDTKQTAEQVSAAITAALTSYSNTEQMQTAITNALTDYYTKDESNNLLAAKQTAEQVSAAITAALTSYSNTEQMQTAITNALTDYYTKDESNNLLTAKQTAEQVSAAITAALTNYSNTEQMQTAITNALTDYYTKDESNNLLAAKQTAEQVSAAITAALTNYSNTEQMQTAITNALTDYYTKAQADAAIKVETDRSKGVEATKVNTSDYTAKQEAQDAQIAALQTAVNGLEAMAEGYVRISGSSSPALSYRSYKYNEVGDFSRESAFSVFFPCLIGTKLTGGDEQVGTILHVLQKLGYEDGTGHAIDIYGNQRAIDGSEGDVMITNVEKLYQLVGHYTVSGQEYDVFLLSRTPFTWNGYDAEELEPFGWSPDYCVSHLDTDSVQRMHSVYNPKWDGSYNAPVAMAGKYIYHQNAETGAITDEYDSTATLLGGAGGLSTTGKKLPTGEQEAMNHNPDTNATVPFMNQTAEGCNRIQSVMLAEGGTFDAHRASLFGSGFCSNDAANAATFEAAGSEARNGLRYQNGQGETVYLSLAVSNAFGISGQYTGAMINSWRNPWHIMEAHRAVSYAVSRGVGEQEWFVFEGNKYKYRSVPGFRGPQDGEMTCVVWKVLSSQLTNAAIDPADNTTHLTGRRIDFIFTTGLLHGITTQTSPAWWTSGLIFTEDENRTYQCYMERDQAALLKSPTDDIDAGDKFPFETAYPLVLADITAGEGYASDYLDGALMLPRNNATKTGGGLHTYVGKYNWFTGSAAPTGKKSVRGFLRGDYANNSHLSPLTLYANHAPSFATSGVAFGTCVRIRRS